MTTTTTTRTDPAEDTRADADRNARDHLGTIAAAHTACQWLRARYPDGNDLTRDARALLREQGWKGEDHESAAEAIEERMREMALSQEVGAWWPMGGAPEELDSYRVLISWGGPACRVTGDLSGGEPHTAWLESQDWYMPWQELEISDEEQAALLWFASLFWWGD